MSAADQIGGLEAALVDRANRLAAEYLANGRQEHERLLAEARQRLAADEERAGLVAKALAERAYQQEVQAAELQLRAELDRVRQELVTRVLAKLPARLEQLVEDEKHYLPILRAWLREGAAAIEHPELVVELNERDAQRLKPRWEAFAKDAAPNKRLRLAAAPLNCLGGVRITSADGNIRIDHTFEGRQERLAEQLQNTVAEHMVPATPTGGN